tara:strand:+ start:863 stop:1009 length:147 start_codon:yes stop_codon:yes gene_type:complete
MKMLKPSGVILEVNKPSVEYALSLGWKEVKPESKRPVKSTFKQSKKVK